MAQNKTITREQFENQIVARAATDEKFRARLKKDPKGAIAELGHQLPKGLKVEVLQESHDKMFLVLPDFDAMADAAEMSDEDLEMVSAASSTSTGTCGSSNCSISCAGTGGTALTSVPGISGSWRTSTTFKR